VRGAGEGYGPASPKQAASYVYYTKARKLLKKAAQQEYTPAFRVLADLCFQGGGMRANPSEGFYWLDMAANKAGDLTALGLWGQKLVQGQVCRQNIPKAKELLEKGAAGGGRCRVEEGVRVLCAAVRTHAHTHTGSRLLSARGDLAGVWMPARVARGGPLLLPIMLARSTGGLWLFVGEHGCRRWGPTVSV
jgi:hypothetical protein